LEREPRHGFLEDIYDGKRWKSFSGRGGILATEFNTGWLLNTDGVQVFKGSNYSIWPVYMMCMNLPNQMRKDIGYFCQH